MISEFVEYVKQVWKNKPNVSSPLNADRLNHMEAGIENNSKKIKETVTAVNELTENNPLFLQAKVLDDWNNADQPGWYCGKESTKNSPSSSYTVGLVLPFDNNAAYPMQIVFSIYSTSINIRTKAPGDSGWLDWRTI